ncbi:MAG: hypothetical protein ACFE0J_20665 [Elainellaceae cyanobacterium]
MAEKRRIYSPKKTRTSNPNVPDALKDEVQQKFDALIETEFKPKYIKPPPEEPRFNYLVDIFTKWYRSYFYICGTYHCPGPNAIAPSFETKYARFEYIGGDRFNVAYMRHTGQWWQIAEELSLDDCLEMTRSNPILHPM